MNDEINALVKKAKDSVLGAEILFKSKFYNFSISRSYYAMFYLAEAILLTKELSYSSHKGVISGFSEHFVSQEIFSRG